MITKILIWLVEKVLLPLLDKRKNGARKLLRKVTHYKHHGVDVAVREVLMGEHREFCLCWYPCVFLKPGQSDNCPVAQKLYEFDVEHNLVTPVWECPNFVQRGDE